MAHFLSSHIDHTKLGPTVTLDQIYKLIKEAKYYHFRGVCLPSCYLKEAKSLINGSNILIVIPISFPFGQDSLDIKIDSALWCIDNGADEIDMVFNIGRFKNKEFLSVENEIALIKKKIGKKTLKVMIETAFLTKEEIITATQILINSGADFIKTSTGYAEKGADLEEIKIIKKHIGSNKLLIKASGGIKTSKSCQEMIEAGASVIGTSNGVSIILEKTPLENY
jgi:deoxyribose-phosphate aldolase